MELRDKLRDQVADLLRAYKDERVNLTDAISGILALPEIAEALAAKRIEGDTIRKAWREGHDFRLGHER